MTESEYPPPFPDSGTPLTEDEQHEPEFEEDEEPEDLEPHDQGLGPPEEDA
jgi:hypothetical protein